MDAEITGRKVKVTPELRQIADEGLTRIEKIVGSGSSAHVVVSAEKHSQAAEVTVKARHHTAFGAAEAPEMSAALRTALDKAEKQALRRRKSLVEKKRQSKTIRTALPAV
jgi:putative sigma-54 modulation protein